MNKGVNRYEYVQIDKLIPYINNARTHSQEQIKQLQASIREFGFINPVLIDSDYNIIAGHGRVMAAKNEGMDRVPCIFIEHLTEAQKKAYIIADNKLAENAGWDMELLKLELEELQDFNFNLDLTGFSDIEIDNMFNVNDSKGIEEDDFNIDEEITESTISKKGDIWLLGDHKVMCGDGLNIKDVELLMDGKKANMVLTEPPYELQITYDTIIKYSENAHVFIFNNDRALIRQLFDSPLVFKKFFVFNHSGCAIPQEGGNECFLDHILISHEINGEPSVRFNKGDGLRTVIKGEYRRSQNHKHEKPFNVLASLIKAYSNDGDLVLDLFGGSGATLMVCEQMGRICNTMELDEKYVDLIVRRYINYKDSSKNIYLIREGNKLNYEEVT